MPHRDPEAARSYRASYNAANKERAAGWRAANKEKIAARRAAYNAANKEKAAATYASYYAANKEKIAAKSAAYYAANKEKIAAKGPAKRAAYRAANKDKIAAALRKRKYGLEPGALEIMLDQQRGRCALCDSPFDETAKPVVEHCHDTGLVRGLVHNNCNVGIGYLGDSVHRAMQAVRYLLKSGQRLADPLPINDFIINELTARAA